MAYSGQTIHYGLPKYVSTDKPSWLDTNDAFDTIDAAIYAAATAVDPSTITTMQNDITALQSGKQDVLTFDAAPASGSVNPVTSGGVYTAVNNVSIALGVTDLKVSTLEGAMGTTDISAIGDGTVTGAIDTLNSSITSGETFAGKAVTTVKLKESINIHTSQTVFTSLANLITANEFISIDVVVNSATGAFPVSYAADGSSCLTGVINASGFVLLMSASGVFADGDSVDVCGTFKYISRT